MEQEGKQPLTWRLRQAAVVAAAVLAGAGCGGRSASPPATTTVTKPAKPVPAAFDPVSFTAISSDQFWLLGSVPCGSKTCASIVHTTDGGRGFATVPAPHVAVSANGQGANSIDTLRFATSLDGFAFDDQSFRGAGRSSAIWQTTDGGGHWRRLPYRDVRAFATGGGDVFLLRATCDSRGCHGLTLDRRRLGGGAWSSSSLPVGRVDPLIALAVHGRSIWISVSPTSGSHPYQMLLHSTDAGATFGVGKSPCSTGLGGDLEPTSTQVVWAVCPTGMLAGALRSADGGVTWKALNTGRELINAARIAPASDTTAVIATGNRTQLLRTTDGGATFSQVYPPRAGWWTFVGFTDAQTGSGLRTVPGRSRSSLGPPLAELVRSTDGGASWASAAATTHAGAVPNVIAFQTPKVGLAGSSSTLSRTVDGGRTWTVVLRTPRPVVSLLHAGRWWARLEGGETLASADGKRWRTGRAPPGRTGPCPPGGVPATAGAVVVTPGGHEWALCPGQPGAGNQSKAVYRLERGHWRRIAWTPMPGTNGHGYGGISSYGYALGLALNDDGFGVIWESRGTLYVTHDGGAHWTARPDIARPELDFGRSAAVLPGGVAFVLLSRGGDQHGRLLATTDAGRTWRIVHRWG